jgi:hypothetical protein
MDPYLEGELWSNFHGHFSGEIARQLNPKLRPKYVAILEERIVMDLPDTLVIATSAVRPDVTVVHAGTEEGRRGGVGTAGTAVAAAPLQVMTVMPSPVPLHTVEIRDTASRQLVAVIEVLSPTNKRGEGRDEYLAKRRRVLLSTAHLLEIDLLRQGQRVPMLEPLPDAPYFAFLSREERRPLTDVWLIHLDQPLPEVPVPLLPGDADVTLDLQEALSNVYDVAGYDLLLDYSKPPRVPLPPEEAKWAEQLLTDG